MESSGPQIAFRLMLILLCMAVWFSSAGSTQHLHDHRGLDQERQHDKEHNRAFCRWNPLLCCLLLLLAFASCVCVSREQKRGPAFAFPPSLLRDGEMCDDSGPPMMIRCGVRVLILIFTDTTRRCSARLAGLRGLGPGGTRHLGQLDGPADAIQTRRQDGRPGRLKRPRLVLVCAVADRLEKWAGPYSGCQDTLGEREAHHEAAAQPPGAAHAGGGSSLIVIQKACSAPSLSRFVHLHIPPDQRSVYRANNLCALMSSEDMQVAYRSHECMLQVWQPLHRSLDNIIGTPIIILRV